MSRAAAHRRLARFGASVAPGARPAPLPGPIEPCHPTPGEEAPSGERWVHEIKFDGYRTRAHLRDGRPAIYTRAGYGWTPRFQLIADALATLPAKDLILDGEAVVADSRGIPDFGLLHADLAAGRKDRLLYYVRPPLSRRLRSARARLADRKRLLQELLAGVSDRILYAEHLEGHGAAIHERAWRHGPRGDHQQTAGRALSLRARIKVDQSQMRPLRCLRSWPSLRSSAPSRAGSPRCTSAAGRETGCCMPAKCRSGYTGAVALDLRERLDPFIRKNLAAVRAGQEAESDLG